MARRLCTREAAKFLENLSDADNEHGEEIDDVQSDRSTASSNTTSMNPQTFTGKNGRLWSSTCPPSSRTRAHNIHHTAEGPLSDAKNIETEEEAFMLFINENILRQVAKYLNVYA